MRPTGGRDLNVLCAMRLYNLGDQSAKEQKSLPLLHRPPHKSTTEVPHTNIVRQSGWRWGGGIQTPVTSVLFYVAPRADENHSTIIINLMEIIFFSKSRRSPASLWLVGSWYFFGPDPSSPQMYEKSERLSDHIKDTNLYSAVSDRIFFSLSDWWIYFSIKTYSYEKVQAHLSQSTRPRCAQSWKHFVNHLRIGHRYWDSKILLFFYRAIFESNSQFQFITWSFAGRENEDVRGLKLNPLRFICRCYQTFVHSLPASSRPRPLSINETCFLATQ